MAKKPVSNLTTEVVLVEGDKLVTGGGMNVAVRRVVRKKGKPTGYLLTTTIEGFELDGSIAWTIEQLISQGVRKR